MCLEVFCEDWFGLICELFDLFVLRGIDLCGIEIDFIGWIYFNFVELEFESFSSLMVEICCIVGVIDVCIVLWMFFECEYLVLSVLLEVLFEFVFFVDMKSKVDMVNLVSC